LSATGSSTTAAAKPQTVKTVRNVLIGAGPCMQVS
jgi:hypothetical protein